MLLAAAVTGIAYQALISTFKETIYYQATCPHQFVAQVVAGGPTNAVWWPDCALVCSRRDTVTDRIS
jgi:hypothetical protein